MHNHFALHRTQLPHVCAHCPRYTSCTRAHSTHRSSHVPASGEGAGCPGQAHDERRAAVCRRPQRTASHVAAARLIAAVQPGHISSSGAIQARSCRVCDDEGKDLSQLACALHPAQTPASPQMRYASIAVTTAHPQADSCAVSALRQRYAASALQKKRRPSASR